MQHQTLGTRPSPLAGKWYPGDARSLTQMLDQFLGGGGIILKQGQILGLLAPHAGLRYSGPVAAHAYATVRAKSFDTVVIIGPMHQPMHGAVLTSAHSAYETPLGLVPVDQETVAKLGERVELTAIQNDPEHSVEIELPFLQRVLQPGFSFIPIMLRDQSEERATTLGTALAETLRGRSVLFVASSDLSHYQTQEIANRLDKRMLDCVESMDAHQVVMTMEMGTGVACGYGAIATVINAVRAWAADHAEIVGYATSGDVTGDYSQVVGYGAAVFRKAAEGPA